MRTDPKLDEIVNGERGMLQGIQSCLDSQCLVSAVTLIYSAIDSLAALARPLKQEDTTRTDFLNWVNTFLISSGALSCNAEDLYGARCGVLHTYGHDSSLRRKGKARALVYQWKEGPAPDAEASLPDDAITIVVEDLFAAFQGAAQRFMDDIRKDSDLSARVNHHSKELLCYKPFEVIHVAA